MWGHAVALVLPQLWSPQPRAALESHGLELKQPTGTEAETACMPLEQRKSKSPRRLQHLQLHVRWMWKGQAALHRAAVGEMRLLHRLETATNGYQHIAAPHEEDPTKV